MKVYPPLLIVNEKDEPIGSAPYAEVKEKNLFHRYVGILIINDEGRVLFQKKLINQSSSLHKWDHSIAGFVQEKESYEQAALREINEKFGIPEIDLHELAHVTELAQQSKIFLKWFYCLYNGSLDPNPKEVAYFSWFFLDEIERSMDESEDIILPEEFKYSWSHYLSSKVEPLLKEAPWSIQTNSPWLKENRKK